jgi:hypothetical protein
MVNICTIIIALGSGRWWIRPHPKSQQHLLPESAAGVPAAEIKAVLPLPTATPSQEKPTAANLSKLVFKHPSIAIKAELDNP